MSSHRATIFAALTVWSIAPPANAANGPTPMKPNIIVFLTDDQGYGDLGCYGSNEIATPNIDRLCAEGLKFESFYVHNRCSPTRAAFLTGCHAQRVGLGKVIYRKDRAGIHSNEITIAETLRDVGYRTALIGKWHLGEFDAFNPVRHGFDCFFGFMEYDDRRSTGLFRDLEMVEPIKSKTDGVHSPKLLSAAKSFIDSNRNQPFFLYYASPLPHTKWKPMDRFKNSSKQGTYGDVVQEIDWQVGELMQTLDRLDLTRKTLFVFASDNGPQLNVEGHGSAGPLRDGKWTNFEGGIRVPCLMRWPAVIKPGTANDEIVGIIDLYPTFCELAGAEVPGDRVIDGRSILPYLNGTELDEPIRRTWIVPDATIRKGPWKLLAKGEKPGGSRSDQRGKTDRIAAAPGSLFDLEKDLSESTEVSEQNPEVVQRLRQSLQKLSEEVRARARPSGTVPPQ